MRVAGRASPHGGGLVRIFLSGTARVQPSRSPAVLLTGSIGYRNPHYPLTHPYLVFGIKIGEIVVTYLSSIVPLDKTFVVNLWIYQFLAT